MTLKIESTSSPESSDLIHNFLHGRYSGVLATADGAGNPHAAVVYFLSEDDFSLLFATGHETQKNKNVEENQNVAFVVYDEKEQTTVQIMGRVEVVEDPDIYRKVVNNMFKSSEERSDTAMPPAAKLVAGGYVVLRLVPQVIKMAIYARPESEDEDIFETLLFSE
jgi:general stress protein 26